MITPEDEQRISDAIEGLGDPWGGLKGVGDPWGGLPVDYRTDDTVQDPRREEDLDLLNWFDDPCRIGSRSPYSHQQLEEEILRRMSFCKRN